jgi:hypothetical protein
MDKAEKERQIIKLYSRMLRFQSLCLYAQKYSSEVTHNRNRFDNIIESALVSLRPNYHMIGLANKLVKLRATKTNG